MQLLEALLNLTKEELDAIRQLYGFKNISNLLKAEKAEQLAALLPPRYAFMLERLDQEAYDALVTILTHDIEERSVDLDQDSMAVLVQHALVFSDKVEEDLCLFFPDELAEAFRLAQSDALRERIRRNTEWVALTHGMLHYYGAMDAVQVHRQLEALTGQPVPYPEMLQVLGFARAYYERMEQTDTGFCDIRVQEPAVVLKEQRLRSEVPFRPLSREQLLAASVPDFLMPSPEMDKFRSFVRSHYKVDREDVESLLLDLQDAMQGSESFDVLMPILDQWLDPPSATRISALFQHLRAFYHATPQWILKGHSPADLRKEGPKLAQPLPDVQPEIASGTVHSASNKIGRNELCPCGSGKKYKKCCMGKAESGEGPSVGS